LKYEEKVETGGRWSKPHVCTASLHSIFELRRSIAQESCIVMLDLDVAPPAAATAAAASSSTLTLERIAGTFDRLIGKGVTINRNRFIIYI
jgi:hypothetical protein